LLLLFLARRWQAQGHGRAMPRSALPLSEQEPLAGADAGGVESKAPLQVLEEGPLESPLRSFLAPCPSKLAAQIGVEGVTVEVYKEGASEAASPKHYVVAHVQGRLPGGAVFESTRAKGQPPMRMALGQGEVIPGMELGLRALMLGARAVLKIPAKLGYSSHGVPRMVPPDTDLTFEVELVEVDGTRTECPSPPPAGVAPEASPACLRIPWWLARVQRPPASEYYLSFCQHLARGATGVLERALPVPRRTRQEIAVDGWSLASDGAVVIGGMQDGWKAKDLWDLEWFRKELGTSRQLVKWIGPVFTRQEALWQTPVWEATVAEYIDYIRALEVADPCCEEQNAQHCSRVYLNGWPAFQQLPWLRDYIDHPAFVEDVTRELREESSQIRSTIIRSFAGGPPENPAEQQKLVDDAYWELTKLFLSPRGAVTRLHYDNGGAHGWLSQVRGRKLFVLFPPEDTALLHPFEGDEGRPSGSWLDPLAEDVYERWPDCEGTAPSAVVVEEGETIFIPQGWWHYAAALDTSVTVMRNFHTRANARESTSRDEKQIQDIITDILKGNQERNKAKLSTLKTADELGRHAKRIVDKVKDAHRAQRQEPEDMSGRAVC